MVPEPDAQASRDSTEPERTFVCPFCGTRFPAAPRTCTRCDGNPVVPVDEAEVYESVLRMCGPDCHPNQPGGASDDDASAGTFGLLSGLSPPDLSACVAPVAERVSHVSRRI